MIEERKWRKGKDFVVAYNNLGIFIETGIEDYSKNKVEWEQGLNTFIIHVSYDKRQICNI